MTPSYATSGSGNSAPDDVRVVNGVQFAILWSGDEYSFNHTWITADEPTVIDLHEHR